MLPESLRIAVLAVTISSALDHSDTLTKRETIEEPTKLLERDVSGPRVGFTWRPELRAGEPLVSQFGWHFEHHVSPGVVGPQFVTQFVPLVAGVEQGRIRPSASLGLGVRLPNGYEFGLGPTVGASYDRYGQPVLRTAVFLTAGRSFEYEGIRIPVNLVLATNRDGSRVSLIAGYAIRRATRRVGA